MTVATRILKRLIRVGKEPKRPAPPSLLRAMKKLVSRSVMREVVASSHDRRQWGVLAAAWVGVSEREFVRAAAREMSVDCDEHVPVPDLADCSEEPRDLLQRLRKVGCSVVVAERAIVRFIAVDPAEIGQMKEFTGTQAVSVAPWSEIVRALDGAERLLAEQEANADVLDSKREDQLCERVLEIVARESEAHGAHAFDVVSNDQKTRYQFMTPDGKTGVGAIHPEAVPPLLRHLMKCEGTARALGSREVFVRSLGHPGNFKISWGERRHGEGEGAAVPRELSRPDKTQAVSAQDATPPAATVSEAAHARAGQALPIPLLVIDDNPMFCRVLERLLTREGFDPCFAPNGSIALERLQGSDSFRPRAILCDLHMPLMNGRELLQRLKDDQRLATIPVVILTSDDDVEAEVELLKGGAAVFLPKSKDPRVLSAQIRKVTQSGGLQEAA